MAARAQRAQVPPSPKAPAVLGTLALRSKLRIVFVDEGDAAAAGDDGDDSTATYYCC